MNRIIRKFWGVALIVILLSTMFIGGAVPAANAATLWWSTLPTVYGPFISWQLAPGTNVSFVKVAPNGDIFAVDVATSTVYKSTNGGLAWAPSVPVIVTGAIVDLVVSPAYATDHTVFVLDSGAVNAQVLISVNGGVTFAVLGGTCAGIGTSMAVAPNYAAGIGEVMVGTTLVGAGAYGDVYIWYKNGVQNWVAQGIAADVTKVAYSPNYLIDSTRVAIASDAVAGTQIRTEVAAAVWDFNLLATTIDSTIMDVGTAPAIISSQIAFPSDFNASSVLARTCFVSINSATAVDNVYRMTAGAGPNILPATTTGVPMGPPTWAPTLVLRAASLVYTGTFAAGSLYYGDLAAPLVLYNTAPMGAQPTASWGLCIGGLTGAGPVYVALASDFATSAKVYAGTSGAESALSVSTTSGLFFAQAGLIDTAIATIDDFSAASATEYYMVTSSGATSSLWKSINSGAAWYRVLNFANALTGIVRLSPTYATDKTAYVSNVGNNAAATAIFITNNSGLSWTPRTSPVRIADIAVKDQYTAYVASAAAGSVTATANGGWTWQAIATTTFTGAINQIKVNAATGALLVGDVAGLVAISLDGNFSYFPLAAGVSVGNGAGVGPAVVAFDTNYAANKLIYAGDFGAGVAGIWRYWVGTSVDWGLFPIDGALDATPAAIVCAPDGTLYATDCSVASPTTGGVVRILHPEDPFALLTVAETVSATAFGDGLVAGALLTKLSVAVGSNVLFAVDTAAPIGIRVYTDTLAMGSAAPVPATPAAAAVLTTTAVSFTWAAVPGAWSYQVQYDAFADWRSGTTVASTNIGDTFSPVVGLAAGVGYNWRVRVWTPVVGPWSATNAFTTQMGIAGFNAPVLLSADNGIAYTGVSPAFQWQAIKAATGYEFQLSKSSDMSNPIVDLTGANALGPVNAYKYTGILANNTTYYFRVRAFTATSKTDWSGVVAFTTVSIPEASAPPIIITTQPQVTITIPPATTTNVVITQAANKEISPTYIWAIIIIGAVLVLAVIVLIVRTRRPV